MGEGSARVWVCLGENKTRTATSPRARSRYVLQSKLLALDMKAIPKDANAHVLIANVPKGERNRNITEKQYSIQCPSYGLSSCTETFCVAKKWWDIRFKNSNGISNQILVHWSSHFKGLYDKKKIPPLVMKMANNHLRNVYCHHQLKHGGTSFPYFDYHTKNSIFELIKSDANVPLFSIAMQVLCHATHCSRHSIYIFGSILDRFVQSPNRQTLLVNYCNNVTTTDITFFRTMTNFCNVNSQPIFLLKPAMTSSCHL